VPPADPLAVKLPPPAATETASVEIAPVPAAEPAPSPLQVTNGRFAGMPLPNLPALTPEPNPATDDAGSPAAALQTARNDDPLTGPLPARPSAAPMSQADETTAAQAELRRASERTGLDSLQLARIEESRRLIAAGNTSLALELTHRLNGELDAASTTYVVKGSENLWQIAEQPQVYGNAYLWPLIWRANAQLKQPTDVKPGMRLRIPTRPAVLDVTEAIDYARRAGGEKMAPVSAASTAAATP
jgi:nucleoid-associated protein YgaU